MPIKKLLVSITGRNRADWQNKLLEIKHYHIREVALFLEWLTPAESRGLQEALKSSCIKKIPLVHLRHSTTRQEVNFYARHFGTRYFTIHENHFPLLEQWRGHYRQLYLELNFDNHVASYVKVRRIGGFCLDLAHFAAEIARQTAEYRYILDHLRTVPTSCNHISGYSIPRQKDLHTIGAVHDFDYLGTLPHAVFSRLLAIEVLNPIADQLRYHTYIRSILEKKLGFTVQ